MFKLSSSQKFGLAVSKLMTKADTLHARGLFVCAPMQGCG